MIKTLALLAFTATTALAGTTPRAEVTDLPRWGAPPTKTYSGFVEVDAATDSHLFYYYVESASAPATDPLVWWFNGGPGASSLAGVFGENGPLILADNGTLIENPYSWNARANVLAVEFSTGIGYSYCANSTRTDPAQGCLQGDDNCSPCLSSDSSVAAHNVAFLEGFLGVFPELKGRPLFLTGESYAGVYGPTLAQALLEHFDDTSVVNLSGMWLTDPCIDNEAQFGMLDFGPAFLFSSGLIDAPLHDTLTGGACDSGRTPVGDYVRKVTTRACRAAWRLYDIAVAGIGDSVHPERDPIPFLPMYIDPLNAIGPSGGPNTPAFLASLRDAIPGANQSKNKVYQIEVGNNGYFGYTSEYAACNPTPASNSSMLGIYRTLAKHAASLPSAANFKRIIVSSGDVDSVVALHGTEAGVRAIGFPQAQSGRLPWFWNNSATDAATVLAKPAAWGRYLHGVGTGPQIGGFATQFETQTPLSFEFLTFKDSGHMVPAYAPQRALHVLHKLTAGPTALLTPPLPEGWDDASEEDFYARTGPKSKVAPGGIMTSWVATAMSEEFLAGK